MLLNTFKLNYDGSKIIKQIYSNMDLFVINGEYDYSYYGKGALSKKKNITN